MVQKFSNVICMSAMVKYGAISVNSENAGIHMTKKRIFKAVMMFTHHFQGEISMELNEMLGRP